MTSGSDLPELVEAAKHGRITPAEFRKRLIGSYVFVLSPEPVQDMARIAPVMLVVEGVPHLAVFSSLDMARPMTETYPHYGKVLFRSVLTSVPQRSGLVLDPGSLSGFAMSPARISEWRELPQKN